MLDIGKATPNDFVALLRKVKPRVIIWAAGTSNNDLAKYIDYGAQVKVYDAMVKAKVRRVVTVSSMGVWDWKSDGAKWFTKEEREYRAFTACRSRDNGSVVEGDADQPSRACGADIQSGAIWWAYLFFPQSIKEARTGTN